MTDDRTARERAVEEARTPIFLPWEQPIGFNDEAKALIHEARTRETARRDKALDALILAARLAERARCFREWQETGRIAGGTDEPV
jgi:hypothetical protein